MNECNSGCCPIENKRRRRTKYRHSDNVGGSSIDNPSFCCSSLLSKSSLIASWIDITVFAGSSHSLNDGVLLSILYNNEKISINSILWFSIDLTAYSLADMDLSPTPKRTSTRSNSSTDPSSVHVTSPTTEISCTQEGINNTPVLQYSTDTPVYSSHTPVSVWS